MMTGDEGERRALIARLDAAQAWGALQGITSRIRAIFQETPGAEITAEPTLELEQDEGAPTILLEVLVRGDVSATREAYARCMSLLVDELGAGEPPIDINLLVSMT